MRSPSCQIFVFLTGPHYSLIVSLLPYTITYPQLSYSISCLFYMHFCFLLVGRYLEPTIWVLGLLIIPGSPLLLGLFSGRLGISIFEKESWVHTDIFNLFLEHYAKWDRKRKTGTVCYHLHVQPKKVECVKT